MAEEPDMMILAEAERKAGAEYVAKLQELGLEMDIACWVSMPFYEADGSLRGDGDELVSLKCLAIVTSWVDRIGAEKIYEQLFKAYDASITPQEVDPFNVTLFSPQSRGGELLRTCLTAVNANGWSEEIDRMAGKSPNGAALLIPDTIGPAFSVFSEGIYVVRPLSRSHAVTDLKKYRRFRSQIEALAA